MDLVVVNVQSSDLTLLLRQWLRGLFRGRQHPDPATPRRRAVRFRPRSPISTVTISPTSSSRPNQKDPSLHLLLGDGFGFHFSTAPLPGGDRLLYVAAGDINGDRIPDIATAGCRRFDQASMPASGTARSRSSRRCSRGHTAKAIALADFDGDGSDRPRRLLLRQQQRPDPPCRLPGIFRTPYNIATATVVNPMARRAGPGDGHRQQSDRLRRRSGTPPVDAPTLGSHGPERHPARGTHRGSRFPPPDRHDQRRHSGFRRADPRPQEDARGHGAQGHQRRRVRASADDAGQLRQPGPRSRRVVRRRQHQRRATVAAPPAPSRR